MSQSRQRVGVKRSRRAAGASLGVWREELIQDELVPILEQIERITLGERGERTVGKALEELEDEGYLAVHSILLGGCDIDHVLVGPGGVFVIETKYRRGNGLITFRNGQGVFIGDKRGEKGPIAQARRGARKVTDIIRDKCGLAEGVWPVVVFVGNWRIADEWASTDARVFTPESLQDYVLQQQPILKRIEIDLIASHLERSARD